MITKLFKAFVIVLIFITSSSFAAKRNSSCSTGNEDVGDLLFKIRGFYSSITSKANGFSDSLGSDSYGIDAAISYFFTDYIAGEFSAGVEYLKINNTAVANTAKSLANITTVTVNKNNDIYMIPITATVQYHVAPFGAIRPYVGGGVHGTYAYTSSKALSVSPGYGVVLQLGVNLVSKDDSFIIFDIKKYFFKSNVRLKKAILGDGKSDITSKVSWNPLVISLGFGFKL